MFTYIRYLNRVENNVSYQKEGVRRDRSKIGFIDLSNLARYNIKN